MMFTGANIYFSEFAFFLTNLACSENFNLNLKIVLKLILHELIQKVCKTS